VRAAKGVKQVGRPAAQTALSAAVAAPEKKSSQRRLNARRPVKREPREAREEAGQQAARVRGAQSH